MTTRMRGPLALFAAWAVHDVEEAITFPETCDYLADRTGIETLRMDNRQSWAAVGVMAGVIGFACHRGARTRGRSRLYRAVLAGLESHVGTHLLASVALRRYTAGVATAVPVMLPGALYAKRELALEGMAIQTSDRLLGMVILIPAAYACHAIVRRIPARGD